MSVGIKCGVSGARSLSLLHAETSIHLWPKTLSIISSENYYHKSLSLSLSLSENCKMQSLYLDTFQNLRTIAPFSGSRHQNPSFLAISPASFVSSRRISTVFYSFENRNLSSGDKQTGKNGGRESLRVKDKDKSSWELSKSSSSSGRRRGRRLKKVPNSSGDNSLIVSAAMLMEIENVLQMQEPVIIPLWSTFASSVSGIWKGIGAVFSPITAEMEPVGIGRQHENLYDCFTLSYIEQVPPLPNELISQIRRKTNWVPLNPYGERKQKSMVYRRNKEVGGVGGKFSDKKESAEVIDLGQTLPSYESFDISKSELFEEDIIGMEPGLVFFEDGSYSRGPVDIPVGEFDESKHYPSPSFKFEQCLVKGCHKRLRIVHLIEFNEGGSNVQIIKVAAYEEQWVGPTSFSDNNDGEFDLKPFSQRKRAQLSELIGSWKVFEVGATPVFGEELSVKEGKLPYVYLCMETLKKRSLPEHSVHFGEEEILDMQDVTVLWLPGGVTGYVDVNEDGILCIGVGWYSDEGINLVMERDYGTDGKLKEVRWKSEVKRRWPGHPLHV